MRNEKGQFKKSDRNDVQIKDNYALIWTTDVNGHKKTAYKIDIEDIEKVIPYRWSVGTDGYAKYRSLKMHRLIMDAQNGQLIDHINMDVTDNRKQNLRFVTHSLNMRNSNKTKAKSGVKHIVELNNGYSVQLKCRGKRYYIGKLKTLEDAIKERDELYSKIKYFEE